MRLGFLRSARLGRQALARSSEELGEPAVRLEVAPDHHAVIRLERLRDAIHQRPREPQRVAHLAHRRAGSIGHEVADHPGVFGPVAVVDVLDDLLAPLGAEVDVDVRIRRPTGVDEPLEQEVVGDRLDPADPERVGHDRAGRAAPALGGDAALLREAHQVPADQEELGQAGPLDDAELVGEPAHDRRGRRVVALPGTRPTQLRQVRERRLPVGHGEAREAVLLELKVDRARRRDLDRGRDALSPRPGRGGLEGHRPRQQLGAVGEVGLAVGAAQVRERVERPAVSDRGQDVVELAVGRRRVVDVVGDDDRQAERLGQRRRLRHEPVVVGPAMVRELDEEAARGLVVAPPEQVAVALGDGAGAGSIADPQSSGELAVATARQRDEALGVLGEERLADPRHGLGPGEIGVRQQPAQAPPAGRRPGEQHEMRSARSVADAAEVLLDRVAMAGQSRPLRAGPCRAALVGERQVEGRLPGFAARPPTPTGDHDDAVGIRHGGIPQLDLDADDGMQAGLLGCADESDGTVEAVVVGGGQPAEPQFDGPGDQLVRCRRPVEEREVGMGVELGIRYAGEVRHGSLRSGGRGLSMVSLGAVHRRTNVLSCHHETRNGHRASLGHARAEPDGSPAPTGRHDRAPDGPHIGAGHAPDLRRSASRPRGPGGVDLAPNTVSAPGGSGRCGGSRSQDRLRPRWIRW